MTFTGTVADIRLLSTTYDTVFTTDYGGGTWNLDPSDTTSTDNTGTVLVDSTPGTPNRYKRVYDGPLDVTWFGAKGDDSTDSTSAFIAFAAHLNPNKFIPQGVYIVARNNVQFPQDNLVLTGAKGATVIKRRVGSTSNGTIFSVKGHNSKISNLSFSDNGLDTYCLNINYGSYTTAGNIPIEDVNVANCIFNCTNDASCGINIGPYHNIVVTDNTLYGSVTANGDSIGIRLGTIPGEIGNDAIVNNNRITGFNNGINFRGSAYRFRAQVCFNIIKNCVSIGIFTYHTHGTLIEGNSVYECGTIGIFQDNGVDSEGSTPEAAKLLENKCLGNLVKNCGTNAYVFEEMRNGIVSDNQALNCGGTGYIVSGGTGKSLFANNSAMLCEYGFKIINGLTPEGDSLSDDITLDGCLIHLNYKDGIISSTMRGYLIIRNCTIMDNGYTDTTLSTYAGIRMINTEAGSSNRADTRIHNNDFGNAVGDARVTASGNQAYGIYLDYSTLSGGPQGASFYTLIDNNSFNNHLVNDIYSRYCDGDIKDNFHRKTLIPLNVDTNMTIVNGLQSNIKSYQIGSLNAFYSNIPSSLSGHTNSAVTDDKLRVLKNPLSVSVADATTTGILVLKHNSFSTITGFKFKISGFSYLASSGYEPFEINLVAYWSGSAWQTGNLTARVSGKNNFSDLIKVGRDASNNICILLGDASTVWPNSKVTIDEIAIGTNTNRDVLNGWYADIITSTSGFLAVNTPTLSIDADRSWIDNNYYSRTQMQTSGQAQLHWDNITNKPDTIVNTSVTSIQNTSDLNTLYPTAQNGTTVYCPNIMSSPFLYQKMSSTVWISLAATTA